MIKEQGESDKWVLGMTNKERPAGEITEGLRDGIDHPRGDSGDAFLKLVYTELHRQAHRYLQKERIGHTLQTTALVHEAYLRLVEQKSVAWESRSHFYAIAATMMRRILIDYAKTKHRVRRGGVHSDLPLEDALTIQRQRNRLRFARTRRSIKPARRKGSAAGKGRRTEIF